MNFMLICTEGENSEPQYLKVIEEYYKKNSSTQNSNIEIISLPLRGNHGYKDLVNKADELITKEKNNPESLYSLSTDTDEIINEERWIICDHDKMEANYGIEEAKFRKEISNSKYELVINKPNFEFFVLLHFLEFRKAELINQVNYKQIINEEADKLYRYYKKEHNYSEGLRIPEYTKEHNGAEKFFNSIINYYNEPLNNVLSINKQTQNHYTEMPKIIKRIKEVYGN